MNHYTASESAPRPYNPKAFRDGHDRIAWPSRLTRTGRTTADFKASLLRQLDAPHVTAPGTAEPRPIEYHERAIECPRCGWKFKVRTFKDGCTEGPTTCRCGEALAHLWLPQEQPSTCDLCYQPVPKGDTYCGPCDDRRHEARVEAHEARQERYRPEDEA